MKKTITYVTGGLVAAISVLLFGCSEDSSGGGTVPAIPAVKPIVEAATPSGFKTTSLHVSDISILALSDDIKSRFFSNGPTEIAGLADSLDGRINEIKTRAAESERTCLSNTPVLLTTTIVGESVDFYAQCYDKISESAVLMFGEKDNTWYLYDRGGQGNSLFVITPTGNGEYTAEGYMGVGLANTTTASCSNSYDGCSYGLISVSLDSSSKAFEMGVAGIGYGFCGAHLKSDGNYLFIAGSPNGAGSACTAYNSGDTATHACFNAGDVSSAALSNCDAIDIDNFVVPQLGRTSSTSWDAANGWPSTGSPNVTLDGNTSDTIYFGWTVSEVEGTAGLTDFNQTSN